VLTLILWSDIMRQYQGEFEFYQEKELKYNFEGGNLSSDGGMLLVREFDEKIGFTDKVASLITDKRNPNFIDYEIIDMLRERLYFLIAGYEDCNDVKSLKDDPAFNAILKNSDKQSDEIMASQPTLSRFENRIEWSDIKDIMRWMIDFWLDQFDTAPCELTLDFDTTDDPCHGHQQMALFHGYYKQRMYHPLIVTCNGHIVLSLLRPGLYHANKYTHWILSFIVDRIKNKYPNVKLSFRADSGLASPKIYTFLEKNSIDYVIGMITNKNLKQKNESLIKKAKDQFQSTSEKARLFQSFEYKAESWENPRRVIAKAEYTPKGGNNRFVITNKTDTPFDIYDGFYCQRGCMENDIKAVKNTCFADRLSCHSFKANQFRLILSTLAHQLLQYMRPMFQDTPLVKMSLDSIRLRLLKVAVQVTQSSRKLWFRFCSAFPYQTHFSVIHEHILAFSP